jgi:hypothetical protein
LKKKGSDYPTNSQIDSPSEEIRNISLFEVLRERHAAQADQLIDRAWQHPSTGQPLLLLQDVQLQEDYGKIIGKLAASHHWPIRRLEEQLHQKIPASAAWPREWEIDTLKLACVLRSADAVAIDERRAPARLFAIRAPTGTSRRHWAFQNCLYPPRRHGETIEFFSKRPFPRPQMDDWWLCYDAITIADEEIRASNGTLAIHTRPTFAAKQIAGARNAPDLATRVKVEGWTPVDTSVRIKNVSNLVQRISGSLLYEHQRMAPLRELIQNSADAIRARRRRDTHFASTDAKKYPGKVRVKLIPEPSSDTFLILIEDNGIGMPASVLSGPLLDFGTSFWASDLAAELYPGLQSDTDFRPVGRFGIGFYSVFSYSLHVIVTSRPYNKGPSDLLVMEFRHGLSGRSELRPFDPNTDIPIADDVSTQVCMTVSRYFFTLLADDRYPKSAYPGKTAEMSRNPQALLKEILTELCLSLDVEVWFDGTPVNAPHYSNWPISEFMHRINPVVKRRSFMFSQSLQEIPDKAAFLFSDAWADSGRYGGRLAINFMGSYEGLLIAVDGMISDVAYEPPIIGVQERRANSLARRIGDPVLSADEMQRWAVGQRKLMLEHAQLFNPVEKYFACIAFSHYNVDISDLFFCEVDSRLATAKEIVDILIKEKEIFVLLEENFHLEYGRHVIASLPGYQSSRHNIATSKTILHCGHCRPQWGAQFGMFPLDLRTAIGTNNIHYCLLKEAQARNLSITGTFEQSVRIGEFQGASTYFHRKELRKGQDLVVDCIVLRV